MKLPRYPRITLPGALLLLLMAALLSCAPAEATPTPIPPAPPAPPVAPTLVPTPTAILIPGAPTLAPVLPTPTRVLPTATPVVTGKPAYGGTLRTAFTQDMRTLDPYHRQGTREQWVNLIIYDSLVEADENFTVVPGLARSWKFSSDGREVAFQMVKGAKFQDGTDFNAQAVKWNFEKLMDPSFGAIRGLADRFKPFIEKIEVADDNTVSFRLNKPYRPLLGHMALSDMRIISPAAWEKYGERGFGKNPVGTGPFKLKEWVLDSYITLERFDKHWQEGRPYLDVIRFQNVPDRSSQVAMIRTGETDAVPELTGTDMPLLKGNPDVKVAIFQTARWNALLMDTSKTPWNSRALRQAIAYSIDRQKIVDVHLGGLGRPAYLMGVGWYTEPTYKVYDYDPQKAKEKLAEAGYRGGINLDYWCMATDTEFRLCEIIQAMMKAAGINANIVPAIASSYYADQALGKLPFSITRWSPRPDPDWVLREALHSGGYTSKPAGYSNPEVDKLIDDALGIYDAAVAGPMYIKAQKQVFDDAPYVTLFNEAVVVGLNRKVQNFVWIPDNQVRYRNLWLER